MPYVGNTYAYVGSLQTPPHAVLWHFNDDKSDVTDTYTFGVGSSISASVKKYGAGSLLVTPVSTTVAYNFGALYGGSWTLEAWARIDGFQVLNFAVEGGRISLDYNSVSDSISWVLENGAIVNAGLSAPIVDDTFQHWAIVRDKPGGIYSLYFNGLKLDDVASAADLTDEVGGMVIVASQVSSAYVDDLRYSPSVLYTGPTYTVPGVEFPD